MLFFFPEQDSRNETVKTYFVYLHIDLFIYLFLSIYLYICGITDLHLEQHF